VEEEHVVLSGQVHDDLADGLKKAKLNAPTVPQISTRVRRSGGDLAHGVLDLCVDVGDDLDGFTQESPRLAWWMIGNGVDEWKW